MLSDREHEAVERLGEVWDDFCAVVGDGPTRDADLREVSIHIHALQNAVLAQAAARAYPNQYRRLGEEAVAADPPVRNGCGDPTCNDDHGEPYVDDGSFDAPHLFKPETPTPSNRPASCQRCGRYRDEPGNGHTS